VATENYEALLSRQRAEVSDGMFSAVRRLRWPAERLAAERERRLRELLAWSVEHSRFHAQRLGGIDIAAFTEADLPSLPIMAKADLMGEFDRVVTDPRLSLDVVNRHVDHLVADDYLFDQYRVVGTSGTTGSRALFVYGWEEWVTFVIITTRWRGRGGDTLPLDTPVGSLFAYDAKHLSGAFHAFARNLPAPGSPQVTHLPASLPVPEIVAGLNAAQPLLLQGYPSAIHLLAHEARAGRLKISPLRVATCGEKCSDEARTAIAEAWGVEVYDYWGCTEGAYAFPCEAGKAMHLPDDLVIVEAVDRDGNVVAPGQRADKILLTNLYNRTQPLIRYEITDAMTILPGICGCGCAHRRITGLEGRTDTFFVYEGDIAVHWLGMMTLFLADPAVVEFQVTQTPRGVDVAVATKGDCDTERIRRGLVDRMEKAGLDRPEVVIRRVDALERLWSGKLRQFQPLERAPGA
jgi:phenylacetate-coenzyme A ligase PaaK-like adenylate-forming protein